jgi:2-(1,2-epoxy-1,2-dihydrophenyl)acetyl-CoA isomerase
MTYETITVESGRVATVTLDRPASANALTAALCQELLDALDSLASDTRVVVLTGADGTFSAGGDLSEMADNEDAGLGAADRLDYIDENGHELVRTLRGLDQPVVAAVSGPAVGAGCNLALACDIVVADESARFGQVFRNVGLHPDAGGTYFLPREVGLKKACELIFTGDIVGAETAEDLGLVNRVVPVGELQAETTELAERIADGPPIAIGLAKESIYENLHNDLDASLDREALAQLHCLTTDDFSEGVAAFGERRDPEFTGE